MPSATPVNGHKSKLWFMIAAYVLHIAGAFYFPAPFVTPAAVSKRMNNPFGARQNKAYAALRTAPQPAFPGRRRSVVSCTLTSDQTLDVGIEQTKEQFKFSQQWYPLGVIDHMDPKKPQSVSLLGKELVLWKDMKSGAWKAFDDACPHRLAPLSEGRVEPDGSLLCAYHAWRFDGSGKCTAIPQSPKEKVPGPGTRSCYLAPSLSLSL